MLVVIDVVYVMCIYHDVVVMLCLLLLLFMLFMLCYVCDCSCLCFWCHDCFFQLDVRV